MTTNTEKVLVWLQEFKCTWLIQNILNDPQLINLISRKLEELEQLLTQEHEINQQDIQTDNSQSLVPSVDQQPSNSSHTIEKPPSRPVILIKRIPLAEANQYLPGASEAPKSKRGRKRKEKPLSITSAHPKKTKKNAATEKLPSNSDEVANQPNNVRRSTRSKKLVQPPPPPTPKSSLPSVSSKNKQRRKLRAIDAEDDDLITVGNRDHQENTNGEEDCEQISRYLGQHGLLSQTKKNNDTMNYTDDFQLTLPSRQSKGMILNETLDITSSPSHAFDNLNPIGQDTTLDPTLENHDPDSLFTTLEMTNEVTIETPATINEKSFPKYPDGIEDISNDEFDPPPISSSPNNNHLSVIT